MMWDLKFVKDLWSDKELADEKELLAGGTLEDCTVKVLKLHKAFDTWSQKGYPLPVPEELLNFTAYHLEAHCTDGTRLVWDGDLERWIDDAGGEWAGLPEIPVHPV